MREKFLIGLAAFIGVAGAAVTALPFFGWYRRRKAAAALFARFREALPDIVGFRYRREKMPFRDGFLDSYSGQVGDLAFRLETEIVPFSRERAFRLRLEARHEDGSVLKTLASFVDPESRDPLAAAVALLRRRNAKREGYHLQEAS